MKLIEGIGIVNNAFTDEYCSGLFEIWNNNEELYYTGQTQAGLDSTKKNTTELMLYGLDYNDRSIKEFDTSFFCNELNKNLEVYLKKYEKLLVEYDHEHNSKLIFNNIPTHYRLIKMQRYIKNEGHYNAVHQEREGRYGTLLRFFVFMLYVNDVEEGGITVFPLQNYSVSPKMGTLVFWPAGIPYYHRGEVPVSNDKYIITAWLEWKLDGYREKYVK